MVVNNGDEKSLVSVFENDSGSISIQVIELQFVEGNINHEEPDHFIGHRDVVAIARKDVDMVIDQLVKISRAQEKAGREDL